MKYINVDKEFLDYLEDDPDFSEDWKESNPLPEGYTMKNPFYPQAEYDDEEKMFNAETMSDEDLEMYCIGCPTNCNCIYSRELKARRE